MRQNYFYLYPRPWTIEVAPHLTEMINTSADVISIIEDRNEDFQLARPRVSPVKKAIQNRD